MNYSNIYKLSLLFQKFAAISKDQDEDDEYDAYVDVEPEPTEFSDLSLDINPMTGVSNKYHKEVEELEDEVDRLSFEDMQNIVSNFQLWGRDCDDFVKDHLKNITHRICCLLLQDDVNNIVLKMATVVMKELANRRKARLKL